MGKLLDFFNKKQSLEERIRHIQTENKEDKNNLIHEYIPFIKKVIYDKTGTYVEMENSDSFSIGLIAFNEAIDKYDENKGNFLTFASVVIKNRLIDEHRKTKKRSNEIFTGQFHNEEEYQDNIIAVDGFESKLEEKEDFKYLLKVMKDFGISMDDLIEETPKHKDTREKAIEIGRYVFENKELCHRFLRTKNLPTKDIIEGINVSKKIIQRSRKFIISVVLILESDLDTLKKYIYNAEGRERNDL